jgi:peptidoglycan/LPS O-acetylase OafA/YrhL
MKRLTQLDGLRGIAALIVVIFHLSLIAQPFLDTNTTGDPWWWISETPLRLATDGTQAVLLFFVLSGLVVALPALRAGFTKFSWKKYFASRFIRLYIPAWGALVVASILILFVPRPSANVTGNYWLSTTNAKSVQWLTFLQNATLMKVGNATDNVLWSLRWEIIFSVLLPVFVLAAIIIRRSWVAFGLSMALCVALTIGDPNHADAAFYLPVFMMGTLMASRLEAIQEWSKHRSRMFWVLTLSASLFGMIGTQLFLFEAPSNSPTFGFLWSLVGAGAAGIILCAIGFDSVRNFLNTRVSQYLGKISFSLYLIHVPILASLAFLFGDAQWWLVAIVGIPLSLAAATVFHRFVEVPSMNLAHRGGARVARPKPEPTTARPTTANSTTGEEILPDWVDTSTGPLPTYDAPPRDYVSGAEMPHYAAVR